MKIKKLLPLLLLLATCNNPTEPSVVSATPFEAVIMHAGVSCSHQQPNEMDSIYQKISDGVLYIKDIIKVKNGFYTISGLTDEDTLEISYYQLENEILGDSIQPEYARADLRANVNKNSFYIKFTKTSYAKALNGETNIRDATKDTIIKIAQH